MRKNISTLIATAIMCMAGATTAMGQISALPFTADFENNSIAPFDAGDIVTTNSWGSALRVSNTTATALFDTDGAGAAYTIANDEEVVMSFNGLHGWQGNNSEAKVQLINSEGIVLVGYTYNQKDTKVTDVVIGGQTVAGFAAFMGQANYDNNKSANGFTHKQTYVKTEGYTPVITFRVHGLGAVTFNMKYMAAKSQNIDKTYSANLTGVKMDIAKIVITDNCTNNDRSIGFDNLSITSEQKMLYNYVINYKDITSGEIVKTAEGAAEKGTIVTIDDEVIWADGVKYYVKSNDAADNAVADDNNTVITVLCEPAAVYQYTVTATDGTNELAKLAESSYYEGETVGYAFPRYFNVEGTLYKKDPVSSVYNATFTLDEDNKQVSAVYSATETTNVIYLAEAETIEALEAITTGTQCDRNSNRAGAIAAEETAVFGLTAGTYKLTAAAYGASYSFKVGETEVLAMAQQGYWREEASGEFTLSEPANLTVKGGTGEAGALDYIFIQSTDGSVTEVTTAIADVTCLHQADGQVYNLNGQRVVNAKKGLYIVNGRKMIVK
ncbi:MAG: hypothetical protein IJT98_06430 [Prevotella sp.]|nr:hypothetical protein [Prevotella sp.]